MSAHKIYDYLIIGGGIVGLNIAKTLKEKRPQASVALLEKETNCGKHASGRNSGVLHAGFYYHTDSLKAKLTVQGNQALKAFCRQHHIPVNECGKVVVAANASELKGLKGLKERAQANGVTLEWMDEQALAAQFPNIKTYQQALYSPTTATVDPQLVVQAFRQVVQKLGVDLFLNTTYLRSEKPNRLVSSSGIFRYKQLINAAGLYADKIAKDFGFSSNYVILPFKGVYLKDPHNQAGLKTNIYPVPNLANPFLGVHYTLTADHQLKIGPTATPAFWRENYKGLQNFRLTECLQIMYYQSKLLLTNRFGFRKLAFEELQKYRKSYLKKQASQLLKKGVDHTGFSAYSKAGIRAQLLCKKDLSLVQDFVIEEDKHTTHVLNAVSPAFTCSMPFANYVVENYILKH